MRLTDSTLQTILEPEGAYSLPDAFDLARHTVDALTERYVVAHRSAADGRAAPIKSGRSTELVELAASGNLPASNAEIIAPIVAAESELQVAVQAVSVLAGARKLAESRLRSLVLKTADEFVVKHLRPAHAETLKEARSLAPKLAAVRVDDLESVLASPPAIQAVFREAKALVARYEQIRDTRAALARLARQSPSEFLEFREQHGRLPANPVARLLAVAASGIAWMPTAGEVREAQRDAHARSKAEVAAMRKRGVPVQSLPAFGG